MNNLELIITGYGMEKSAGSTTGVMTSQIPGFFEGFAPGKISNIGEMEAWVKKNKWKLRGATAATWGTLLGGGAYALGAFDKAKPAPVPTMLDNVKSSISDNPWLAGALGLGTLGAAGYGASKLFGNNDEEE